MNTWTIKKSSQSYRFLDRYYFKLATYPRPLNNFCDYYRKLLFTILWTFLAGYSFCAGLGFLILGPFGFNLLTGSLFDDHLLIGVPVTVFAVLGAATIVGLVGAVIVLGIGKVISNTYDYAENKGWIKSEDEKTPGVIRTWYKSHKQKYCPLVEIVE